MSQNSCININVNVTIRFTFYTYSTYQDSANLNTTLIIDYQLYCNLWFTIQLAARNDTIIQKQVWRSKATPYNNHY